MASLNSYQKVSSCSRWQLTQRPTTINMQRRQSDWPLWGVCIAPHTKLRDHCGKIVRLRDGVDYKQTAYELPESMTACLIPTKT